MADLVFQAALQGIRQAQADLGRLGVSFDSTAKNAEKIATSFNKVGATFGTIAGMIPFDKANVSANQFAQTMNKVLTQLQLIQVAANRTNLSVQALGASGGGLQQISQGISAIGTSASSSLSALSGLRGIFLGLGAVMAAHKIIEYADSYLLLKGRLALVADGTENVEQLMTRLFGVAQRTSTEFNTVAEVYGRMARNITDLTQTQEKLVKITESVQQATRLSGITTIEATAGMIQFGQAMASGLLRGDELRSLMENMPRLIRAIADGLGKSIGDLRKMAEEGKLTAEKVLPAIASQSAVLRQEFEKLPRTFEMGFTRFANSAKLFFGILSEGSGLAVAFNAAIDSLSSHLDILSAVLVGALGFPAFMLAIGSVIGMFTRLGAAVVAFANLVHISISPITGILTAVALAVGVGTATWLSFGDSASKASAIASGALDGLGKELQGISAELAKQLNLTSLTIYEQQRVAKIKAAETRSELSDLEALLEMRQRVLRETRSPERVLSSAGEFGAFTQGEDVSGAKADVTNLENRIATLVKKLADLQAIINSTEMKIQRGEIVSLSAQAKPVEELITGYKNLVDQIEAFAKSGENFKSTKALQEANKLIKDIGGKESDIIAIEKALRKLFNFNPDEGGNVLDLLSTLRRSMSDATAYANVMASQLPDLGAGLKAAFDADEVVRFQEAMKKARAEARLALQETLRQDPQNAFEAYARYQRQLNDITQKEAEHKAKLDAKINSMKDANRELDNSNQLARLQAQLVGADIEDQRRIQIQIIELTKRQRIKNVETQRDRDIEVASLRDQPEIRRAAEERIRLLEREADAATEAVDSGLLKQAKESLRELLPELGIAEKFKKAMLDLRLALSAGFIDEAQAKRAADIIAAIQEQSLRQITATSTALRERGDVMTRENEIEALAVQSSLAYGDAQLQLQLRIVELRKALALYNLTLEETKTLQSTPDKTLHAGIKTEFERLRTLTVQSFDIQRDAQFAQILKKNEEMMMEPFKNALQGIQSAFADMFEKIFSGGVDSFKDLAAAIKKVFFRLAAEIATLLVFRPVLGGVLGSVGLGGLAQQLGATTVENGQVRTLGFGDILGGAGKFGGFLNNVSAGGLFNTVGSPAIPQLDALTGLDVGTPAIPGSEGLLGGTLGGYLSGGAMGFGIGSLIGSLSPFGKVGPGGSIGGTLGGLAGVPLIPFLGPLAPLGGSILGGLFGSLFGPKPSVGPVVGGFSEFDNGRFSFSHAATDNKGDPATARKIADDLTKALEAFRKVAGFNVGQGFRFAIGQNPTEKFNFNLSRMINGERPNSAMTDVKGFETFDEAFIAGIRKSIEEGDFTGLGDDIAKAIANSTAKSVEDFGKDVEFAASFRDIFEFLTQGLDPVKSQMAQLKSGADEFAKSFQELTDDFIARSVDLGLASEEDANAAMQALLKATLGLTEAKPALEGVALALETNKQNFMALLPVMESVGFTTAEATDLINQGISKFKTDLGDTFLENLGRRATEAMGRGFLNSLEDIGTQADTTFREALTLFDAPGDTRLGESIQLINDEFGGLVNGVLENLDKADLQAIIDHYAEATDAQGMFIEQMAINTLAWRNVTEAVEETTDALTDAGRRLIEDIGVRELKLAGDDRGALILQGAIDKQRELDAALEEGLNSTEIARLAAVIDGELNEALEKFDEDARKAADAAREAAEAAVEAANAFRNSVIETMRDFNLEVDAIFNTSLSDKLRRALGDSGVLTEGTGPFDALLAPIKAIAESKDITSAEANLAIFQDALNIFAQNTDDLKLWGVTQENLAAVGQFGIQVFQEVTGSFDDVTGAVQETNQALEELARAFASVRDLLTTGVVSGVTELGLDIQTAISQIAPDLQGTVLGPIENFMSAARTGKDFMDEFFAAINAVSSLEGLVGPDATQSVNSLRELLQGILNFGLEQARALNQEQRQDPTPTPDTPQDFTEQRARFNADVFARLLDSQGKVLEAQLARFDFAATEQKKEAIEVGADLKKLNQVLDAERKAIIAAWNKQGEELTNSLQVRLLRAMGKTLDAELLEFDIQAAQLRADAERLGVSMTLVNDVLARERDNIIKGTEDFSQDVTDAFDDIVKQLRIFVDELGFIEEAQASPFDRLREAQDAFARAIQSSMGGNQADIQRLPDLARSVLELARDVFATSPAFFDIFDQVRNDLTTTLDVVEGMKSPQEQEQDEQQNNILDTNLKTQAATEKTAERLRSLIELNQNIINLLAVGLGDSNKELDEANKHLTEIERLARLNQTPPQTGRRYAGGRR